MAAEQAADGLVVAGMHRSGTSVATRALHALGLALARSDDLMGAAPSNPTGHFESSSVTALNDELLLALGGTWSAPPDLGPGWEEAPPAASLADRAAATFAGAHPDAPWVWKDPRTSLTLPFWKRVLGPHPLVVVVRHPAEVARSLEARDRLEPPLGTTLWFRYMRALLRAATGLPVLVAGWDGLRDDPGGWLRSAREWMAEAKLRPREALDDLAGAVGVGISSIRLSGEERHGASFVRPEDRSLFELAASLEGPHEEFPALDLPEETEDRRRLLAERRGEELRGLLARAGSAEVEADLRRYVERLEAELRRQVEAHAETTVYVRHVEDEIRKRTEAQEEVGAYVRHLEEEMRRKDAHIEDLSGRGAESQSSKKRS